MMDYDTLLEFLRLAEKLKCNTRHSWTSGGRRESVAEHSWRLMVFAWLIRKEFPDLDMQRVLELCLFHDIGEAVTGDVPAFEKNDEDRSKENRALEKIARMLPGEYCEELEGIFHEIEENRTSEAQLFHALDKMEAVIQHNEAPISTWLPLEYELQLNYGMKQAEAFPYTKELRERINQDVLKKIAQEASVQVTDNSSQSDKDLWAKKEPDR